MGRIVIFGNSGAGKTTCAKAYSVSLACPYMDLDSVAWDPLAETPTRRAHAASVQAIRAFMASAGSWVVEGCYAGLLEVALAEASEIVFLNPGVQTCIDNARNRPYEPHKYPSPEAQDANHDMLIDWIKNYEWRTDEFSYATHRRLFDAFHGSKQEFSSNDRKW